MIPRSALIFSTKSRQVNHYLPNKIVIFRDGVGDGQLATVATYEQEQLSSCFEMFGETYKPSLTIVIVQKRINTRIFSVLVRMSARCWVSQSG